LIIWLIDKAIKKTTINQRKLRWFFSFARGECMFLYFSGSKKVELIKYSVCGAVATVTDIGLLYLLESLAVCNYRLAASLAFVAGMTAKYLLFSWLILVAYQRLKRLQETLIFLVTGLVGLGINYLIINSFAEVDLVYSKALSIVIVVTWNYLATKTMLFNKPRP